MKPFNWQKAVTATTAFLSVKVDEVPSTTLTDNQSRLGRRNPSADSLVAYICSFAYWIPFAYASSPLLKLSRHNPDDFFSFCTKLWYISEILVENRPPPLKTKNKNFVKSFYHHLSTFLIIYSKASQKLKILKFNQERPLKFNQERQKNNFGNFGQKSDPAPPSLNTSIY